VNSQLDSPAVARNWELYGGIVLKKVSGFLKRILSNRYTLLGIRLVLGTTLILAAVGKIPEQARFVDVVTQYGLLPWSLAQAYGNILPWLELTLGVCLVSGFLVRLTAGASILMVISFIVANGTAVYSHNIMECGCFGVLYEGTGYLTFIKTSDALVIDVVMVLMALTLLLFGGGRWGLDSLIWPKLKSRMPKREFPV
jgi:uncharacterized membrane protein YphA (DoxX/SURF4 family)